VDFIGHYFARVHKRFFPSGININFVRHVKKANALEYRCFERGINRETLACGTGALASAFVAERLNMVQGRTITVLPYRCRWHDRGAVIRVQKTSEGWVLFGRPIQLCHGTFNSERFLPEQTMPGSNLVSTVQNPFQQCAGIA
jgi:diaminopimelate epimerase